MPHAYSRTALSRNLKSLLTGKLLSAFMTFGILLTLVRLLPLVEYGAYVTLMAMVELGYALSQFGLNWIGNRYLPEYQLKASPTQLRRYCFKLIQWRFILGMVIGILFYFSLTAYLTWIELNHYAAAALIFLCVLLLDTGGRFIREALFEPLLLQSNIYKSMFCRQMILLGGLLTLFITHQANLMTVAILELLAAGLTAMWSLYLLNVFLKKQGPLPQNDTAFIEPTLSQQFKMGLQMYWAHLFTLTYSPQLIINVLQKLMGGEAAALFGFLRNLNEQITRYLPATFLFGLIRPKMVAQKINGQGPKGVSDIVNLAGKVSLFVLFGGLPIALLTGDTLITLLSGSRLQNTDLMFFWFLCLLIPFSQRLLLESTAVTFEHAKLCVYASMSGIFVLPAVWISIELGFGLLGVLLAMFVGQLTFNFIVAMRLVHLKVYYPDTQGYFKMVSLVVVLCCIAYVIKYMFILNTLALILSAFTFGCLYLLCINWLKPFNASERSMMLSLLKKQSRLAS